MSCTLEGVTSTQTPGVPLEDPPEEDEPPPVEPPELLPLPPLLLDPPPDEPPPDPPELPLEEPDPDAPFLKKVDGTEVPVVRELALKASKADVHLTIDAEEADRLELQMDVFEALLAEDELFANGWAGFIDGAIESGLRSGVLAHRLAAAGLPV